MRPHVGSRFEIDVAIIDTVDDAAAEDDLPMLQVMLQGVGVGEHADEDVADGRTRGSARRNGVSQ